MAKTEIAIDLGTAYTSIYVAGNGIVLREPSVIAFGDNGNKRTPCAVGIDAYEMIGKSSEKTKIVCPITDGVIKDADAAALMLREFVRKILPGSYIIKPKIHAVVGVPVGITVAERKMYEETLIRAGVDEVDMVNSVLLAAVATDIPLDSTYGGFVMSIGAGVSEFAVVGQNQIIKANAINIGGDMIDRHIVDSVRGIYRLKIDIAAVRRAKDKIASLIRNDCARATVGGIDIESKKIRSQEITADKLYSAIYLYYENIISSANSFINACSAAVAEEIENGGVTVVGGGANIRGLAKVISDMLQIRVKIPHDPQYATILGGGLLLSDRELLDEIIMHA